MRIELPDDAWAEVAGIDELRDGDRKAVNRAVNLGVDPASNQGSIPGSMEDDMMDALLKRIVRGWSFTQWPLPRDDAESLDRLTLAQARALREGVSEHMSHINGEVSPTTRGTDPTAG